MSRIVEKDAETRSGDAAENSLMDDVENLVHGLVEEKKVLCDEKTDADEEDDGEGVNCAAGPEIHMAIDDVLLCR